MNWQSMLFGGAAIGMVAAMWGHIKAFLWKCCNMLIQRVEINEINTQNAVVSYLIQNYKVSSLYDKTYSGIIYNMTSGKVGLINYEEFGKKSLTIWNGWIPFFYTKSTPKEGNNSQQNQTCSITFVRGTINIDEIIKKANEYRNNLNWNIAQNVTKNSRRFFIKHVPSLTKAAAEGEKAVEVFEYKMARFRWVSHDQNEIGHIPKRTQSSLDLLVFPEHVQELIKEIKVWHGNKEWYKARGIPWKRGWMLYGQPGTGKTALARAFAEDLDVPVFVFNLCELTNHEFVRAWMEMQQNTPCIALIEDIDNVFHGRENISQRRRGSFLHSIFNSDKNTVDNPDEKGSTSGGFGISFDVLLNCIDGIEKSDGIFTIITTNDITKIDSALGQPRKLPDGRVEFIGTRPGRIDKIIELTYMIKECKIQMAKRVLSEYPDVLEEIMNFIEQNPDYPETPAQFLEKCSQAALKKLWEKPENDILVADWNS